MSIDDATQRMPAVSPDAAPDAAVSPDEVTTVQPPLPGPLDIAGSSARPDATEVLSLDDLFPPDPEPAPQPRWTPPEPAPQPMWTEPASAAAAPVVTADAPTWTAMPLPAPPAAAPAAPAAPEEATKAPHKPHNQVAARLHADAQAAWASTRRRTGDWLRAGDNAVILLTALVALILIVAVAAFTG